MAKVKVLLGTQIHIAHPQRVKAIQPGVISRALFDSDGTLSRLRDGWQSVMGPMMVSAICGSAELDEDLANQICSEVDDMIARTTGIRTIQQMTELVGMVKAHGLVPADKILDPWGYKELYLKDLRSPVETRMQELGIGLHARRKHQVSGSEEFAHKLYRAGVVMRVFSGTDQEDVQRELTALGLAQFFVGIHGAAKVKPADGCEKDKADILRELMTKEGLTGDQVVVFGDGPVEIEVGSAAGCLTVGLATVEEEDDKGWNQAKLERLQDAGADIIMPDFQHHDALLKILGVPTAH